MRLIRRLFASPFGLAVLGCLLLAVWALWSGGILDGPVARKVRSSSVYAAPGTQAESYPVAIDEANAHAILIGHDVALDCGAGLPLEAPSAAAGIALVTSQGEAAADGLRAAAEALTLLTAPAQATQAAPA